MNEEREKLFEFVLYLVSCARLCVDEPSVYGSFRLVEGASRLISLAEGVAGLEVDAFLRTARERIETHKVRLMDDPQAFVAFLTELLRDFSREATHRNLDVQAPAAGV